MKTIKAILLIALSALVLTIPVDAKTKAKAKARTTATAKKKKATKSVIATIDYSGTKINLLSNGDVEAVGRDACGSWKKSEDGWYILGWSGTYGAGSFGLIKGDRYYEMISGYDAAYLYSDFYDRPGMFSYKAATGELWYYADGGLRIKHFPSSSTVTYSVARR